MGGPTIYNFSRKYTFYSCNMRIYFKTKGKGHQWGDKKRSAWNLFIFLSHRCSGDCMLFAVIITIILNLKVNFHYHRSINKPPKKNVFLSMALVNLLKRSILLIIISMIAFISNIVIFVFLPVIGILFVIFFKLPYHFKNIVTLIRLPLLHLYRNTKKV